MSVSTSFEAFKDDYKSEVCQSSNTTTLITMSNSRYTLQVETDDANLMYAWRVSMEARVPFTAWTVYEYYLSRSGMDQALRECRETMRRLEDTQDSQFNNLKVFGLALRLGQPQVRLTELMPPEQSALTSALLRLHGFVHQCQ